MDDDINEDSKELQKTAVIKILAIIGFIVALVFVAWLAVQAVRLVPSAFTTLATIAKGLKGSAKEESDFTIAADKNIVNVGETFTVSWTQPSSDGAYVFSYQCTDGIAAEIRTSTGTLSPIPCGIDMPQPLDQHSVAILFSSEKSRFADVHYMIRFTPTGTTVANEQTGIVTITNPKINASSVASSTATTTDTMRNNPNTTTYTASSTQASSTRPAAPHVTTPRPKRSQSYRTVPAVTTAYPASNPAGASDLAVAFIGVGTYNESSQTFIPKSSLSIHERAALRFEVKNIGTKTSTGWYFSAMLPTTPALTYSSSQNMELKPNERQIITLQFGNVSADSSGRITVAVTGGGDNTVLNNVFSRQIVVTN